MVPHWVLKLQATGASPVELRLPMPPRALRHKFNAIPPQDVTHAHTPTHTLVSITTRYFKAAEPGGIAPAIDKLSPARESPPPTCKNKANEC